MLPGLNFSGEGAGTWDLINEGVENSLEGFSF